MNLDQILCTAGRYEIGRARIIDPEALKEAIQKATGQEMEGCGIKAGVEVSFCNVSPLIELIFEEEKAQYGNIGLAPIKGTYLLLKSDSSRVNIGHNAYEHVIAPILNGYGYSHDDISTIETCFADIFANAVIFGSRAGTDEDYTRRCLDVPSQEEKRINRQKPICLEFLITPDYALGRATDTGKGISPSEYSRIRKYACVPDNFNELSKEEQKKYMKSYGRGLFMIEELTGEKPLFVKKNAFSASFIKHKGKHLPN